MTSQDKSKISRLINKIRDAQDLIAAQAALIAQTELDLAFAMGEAGVTEQFTTKGHAYFKPQKGRAVNTIDPVLFRDAVDEDEFLECISVSVTKAKEVLPAKALARITTTIPGKDKEPKLVVEEVK